MPGDDKTEKATPKRRRDERKKGNVLLCQDIITLSTLVGSILMLRIMFPNAVSRMTDFFHRAYGYLSQENFSAIDFLGEVVHQAVVTVVITVGPMLLATALIAVAATVAQTRFLVAGEIIKPKFNKINPLNGFKKLFSLRSIIEALKGLIKITLLMVLIYNCLTGVMYTAANFMYTDLHAACEALFMNIFNMLLQVVLAFAAVAFFDLHYQRGEHERPSSG